MRTIILCFIVQVWLYCFTHFFIIISFVGNKRRFGSSDNYTTRGLTITLPVLKEGVSFLLEDPYVVSESEHESSIKTSMLRSENIHACIFTKSHDLTALQHESRKLMFFLNFWTILHHSFQQHCA